jgi:transcriptional repressor NrdR
MRCPDCQHEDSRVIDSRTAGDAIRRRRQCSDCGTRFTTHERLEMRTPWVIKKMGQREPFSRDKVLNGIALACRKRPIDAVGMEAAVRQVEASLVDLRVAEISTSQVGEAVMRVLRETDAVAYVRFASVYREFESIAQFAEAITDFAEPQ